jgi:hypothetical protein
MSLASSDDANEAEPTTPSEAQIGTSGPEAPKALSEAVRAWVDARERFLMVLLFGTLFALAPLSVIEYGWLPPDDALRHAATATSGRSYAEVLVFDPGIPVTDSTPGWHRLLRAVHQILGFDKFALVSFSMFGLFVAFTCAGLLLMARPEAWGIAVSFAMALGWGPRWLLGRPYLLVCAATAVFCLLWDRLREDATRNRAAATCGLVSAVTVWLHSTWFLLLAVPAVSVFSGDRRASRTLLGSILAGTIVGAVLTLDPVRHLSYPIVHTARTMGAVPGHFRVTELWPGNGYSYWVLVFGLLLVSGQAIPALRAVRFSHPAFLLFAVSWALSFKSARFMSDLGIPALIAGTALMLQAGLDTWAPRAGARRWWLALGFSVAALWSMSANHGRRWEASPLRSTAWFQENPEEAREWLPGPNGILYASNMRTFFSLYFTYPNGAWKYILGLEQAIMPKEDLAILHEIWDTGAIDAYAPWVEKLGTEDRLFIPAPDAEVPDTWEDVEVFRVPRYYLIVRRTQATP